MEEEKKQAQASLLGAFNLHVSDTDEPNIVHIHVFVAACRDTQKQYMVKASDADPGTIDLPQMDCVSMLYQGGGRGFDVSGTYDFFLASLKDLV